MLLSLLFSATAAKDMIFADISPIDATPDLRCSCHPHSTYTSRHEETARQEPNYGCWGGCGGTTFEFHYPKEDTDDEMHYLSRLELWPSCGASGAFCGVCYHFSNGKTHCGGGRDGNYGCSFDFKPTDRLIDMHIHGNGKGERWGAIEFHYLRDGQSNYWSCGEKHTAYAVSNAKDKIISGFFGGWGYDIDQIGIYLHTPQCKIVSQDIISMECVSPDTNGNCMAAWKPNEDDTWMTVEAVCNACKQSNGKVQCGFEFTLAQEHGIETSSTTIDQMDLGGELSITEGFSIGVIGFGDASSSVTTTVHANYARSWENSESQFATTSTTISSSCSLEIDAGHASKGVGTTRVGNMMADIVITVKTTFSCGSDDEIKEYDGQITVSDVAMIAEITTCTFEDYECNASKRCTERPTCKNCVTDIDCLWINNKACVARGDVIPNVDEVTQCPSSCTRPPTGCTNPDDVYSQKDCDGDGAFDQVCQGVDWNQYLVLSSEGCPDNWQINNGFQCVVADVKMGQEWIGVVVKDGKNCEEAGFEYIYNPGDCEKALADIGQTLLHTTTYKPAPQGCYSRKDRVGHSTGQFTWAPENAMRGKVGDRFPVCKSYATKSFTSLQAVELTGTKTKSCVKLGMTFNGKPYYKFGTEHIKDCFKACKHDEECGGWAWYTDKKAQCRLFKPKHAKRQRNTAPDVFSVKKDCNLHRA